MVRRALRNVNVISREGQKRVLSYVSQEETAELLTRGVLHDIPIVTAVRKADGVCDILRYSYSTDMADSLCRTMTPICGAVTLLIAVGMTLIRMGNGVRDALDQLFLLHAGTIAGGVLRYGERPGSQSAAGA